MSEYHNDIPQMQVSPQASAPAIRPKASSGMVITKADIMRELRGKLPTNDLGLPDYIYRTDVISTNYIEEHTTEAERVEMLDAASFQLDYAEGYPMLPDGTAFWTKLDFEPIDAFNAFAQHLETASVSVNGKEPKVPVRTYEATAHVTGIPIKRIKEYALLYYWSDRTKAFDLFMVASFRKRREMRAISVDEDHFSKAQQLTNVFMNRMLEIVGDEDAFEEMRPKEVIDALERMMKMTRLSVGLSNNGNAADKNEGPRNASLQVALRNVAQQAGEERKDVTTDDDQLETIMNDPDMLVQMQDIIIKMQSGGK